MFWKVRKWIGISVNLFTNLLINEFQLILWKETFFFFFKEGYASSCISLNFNKNQVVFKKQFTTQLLGSVPNIPHFAVCFPHALCV